MKYSTQDIKIKDNWFDGDDNKYKHIGHEGLFLYLNLFRFFVGDKSPEYGEYTFITSIASLRKATGYTSKNVDDLIRLLIRYKIIETNITRWTDYMFDGNGKLLTDKMVIIYAIDKPLTTRIKNVDHPVDELNYYTNVDPLLVEHYGSLGLGEKYIALYCLLRKLSKNTQRNACMGYDKMAEVLGVGKDLMTKMIHTMNRENLLATYFKESINKKVRIVNGEKVRGRSSEHYVLFKLSEQKEFIKTHGKQIQKNIIEWSK